MIREDVYKLIDGERDYQDKLGPDRRDPTEVNHSVGDYLVMLSTYLRRAQDDWTNYPGVYEALDEIRKIGAIAVRCIEEHGAPLRQP
jgi:hypothetical protein